jgi:hypothetical protein
MPLIGAIDVEPKHMYAPSCSTAASSCSALITARNMPKKLKVVAAKIQDESEKLVESK